MISRLHIAIFTWGLVFAYLSMVALLLFGSTIAARISGLTAASISLVALLALSVFRDEASQSSRLRK